MQFPWSHPSSPFKYWLREDKVENFYIEKGDIKLGAWIVGAPLSSLKKGSHVFVYVHGNAKDRSEFHRVRTYKLLSKWYPVISFDYSCFADSSCRHSAWMPPTEDELVDDLNQVISFLVNKGILYSDIAIVGHSLGTAIASKFLYHNPQAKVAGLCLLAPMASVPLVAMDYPAVPLLKPFSLFSHELQQVIMDLVQMKFNSTLHLPSLNLPIFLVHGGNDMIIPVEHSKILYNAILDVPYDLSHRGFDLLKFQNQVVFEIHPDWTHKSVAANSYEYYKSDVKDVRFLNIKYGKHNDLESFDLFEEYLNEFVTDVFPILFDAPNI